MESINSWINEDEVRKLAEELTAALEVKKEEEELQDDDSDDFALTKMQGKSQSVLPKKPLDSAIVVQAMKDSKSSSLADASAMAASVGLIGKSTAKPVDTPRIAPATPHISSDHYLNTVPVSLDQQVRAALPSVHTEKEMGTFEEIDLQLAKTVKAKGICVIDRDGDVLYSSLQNQQFIAFTVESMVGAKLMQTQEGEFGNIRIKVSASEYLEFVSVKTTRGVLILAVSMDSVLGNTNAQYVAGDVLKIADLV